MRPVVVIPVYNHERAIAAVVEGVLRQGLAVILVDDGSHAACAQVLDGLATRDGVTLVRRAQNGGKGAAVTTGLEEAHRQGYSHAVQLDADGQHRLDDLPRFLDEARAAPTAFVTGRPRFDDSVPRSRLYGRYLTHVFVWLNTLSFAIADAMCGFRVYPLRPTLEVLAAGGLGQRMDFDPELAVRLVWAGVPVVNVPTAVTYPTDGVSHFDVVADNARISWMHTRLFFGMLWRLPRLLWRKVTHA
ncbi:MAG: glycosyltransferase family 2 protein [Myxococcaceae bacterium]|jgi:glycosyltransferase involved in cell wall biosynthesis|nr:glycosyltransferase family 2 protein [Myxococcaceae bacterium]